MRTLGMLAVSAALAIPTISVGPASAQLRAVDRDGYDIVGVRLSERERRNSQPVQLPDGRVVLRPVSNGIPWLFGFGDARGAPSGVPTTNGVTPSMSASTPSGGLVPGQEPR
ncbi:hypothetical protein [Fulvimarina sp. MAC8]|uniref:hypothetical protein n=1 Tax=Fulvimarina sp. MAC8 TaxID=3162874 RepID=UPI0032EF013A